jgi:hypothetical protein
MLPTSPPHRIKGVDAMESFRRNLQLARPNLALLFDLLLVEETYRSISKKLSRTLHIC